MQIQRDPQSITLPPPHWNNEPTTNMKGDQAKWGHIPKFKAIVLTSRESSSRPNMHLFKLNLEGSYLFQQLQIIYFTIFLPKIIYFQNIPPQLNGAPPPPSTVG